MIVKNLTGVLDYDRARLPLLDPGQRIDYFEKRVRLVAVNPLARILATEILVEGSSAILIFGVSLCCAIEATGKFLTGGRHKGSGANGRQFQEFLARYMTPEFQTGRLGNETYGTVLWKHFRNGLAHGFSVSHGGFEGNPEQPYFTVKDVVGTACLEINPSRLFADYAGGFERYLADLRGCPVGDRLFQDFDLVFELVFIRGK